MPKPMTSQVVILKEKKARREPKEKPVMPNTPKYTDLRLASKLTSSLDEEFKKRLTHSAKPPIELEISEIRDFITQFSLACSKKMSLSDLIIGSLEIVYKDFGTHTPKFPNLNISLPDQNAIVSTNKIPSTHGCVSTNSNLQRRYLCAGNGSKVPYYRFLLTPITINGVTRTVAEDIMAQGLLYKEMIIHAPSITTLAQVLHNRFSNPSPILDARNPNGIHGGVPTIFWPTAHGSILDDNNFHLISPVAHTGMIAEIIMRQKRDAKNFGYQPKMLIGGTQPQNGGLLTMDLGGFVPHFLSIPPVVKPFKALDLYEDFKALQQLTNNDGEIVRNNFKVKESRAIRIKRIVDRIIDGLIDSPIGDLPSVDDVMSIVEKQAQRVPGYVIGSDVLEIFKETVELAISKEISNG